ncbi:MAG: hypothetical protein NTW99_02145 [Chloroflexi bacterium]|nr:hypothetical protein [Chloroflexota bacterium]
MDSRFLRNVIIKGLVLFLILDLSFAALPASLGKLSFYNHLFAGRQRFPFGEDSSQSYNLSLFNLDAMFASHTGSLLLATRPPGARSCVPKRPSPVKWTQRDGPFVGRRSVCITWATRPFR